MSDLSYPNESAGPIRPNPDMPGTASGLMNVFVDPSVTAKAIPRNYFWLWPVLIMAIASLAFAVISSPIVSELLRTHPPEGMDPSKYAQSLPMIQLFTKIMMYLSPLWIVVGILVPAALVLVACNVLDIKVSFRDLFTMVAACSLIKLIQMIATIAVVLAKGNDIQSMEEITSPAFGLDIFLHDGVSKIVLAFFNFFSIFEIWYIIVLAFCFAYFTRNGKARAFIATSPAWLIALLFTLVGALFRRT